MLKPVIQQPFRRIEALFTIAILVLIVCITGLAVMCAVDGGGKYGPASTTRVNNLEITGTTNAAGLVTSTAGIRGTGGTVGGGAMGIHLGSFVYTAANEASSGTAFSPVYGEATGTYDTGLFQPMNTQGVQGLANASKSAGAMPLINRGGFFMAMNGDENYGVYSIGIGTGGSFLGIGKILNIGNAQVTGEVSATTGVRLTDATTGPLIRSGTGSPNGVVSATIGSVFLQTNTAAVYQNTDGATEWTQLMSSSVNGPDDFLYGGGFDGNCNFDGVTTPVCGATLSGAIYTMQRPIYATNISGAANQVVETNGSAVYWTGTIGSNTIIFRRNANSGSNSTGGAALANGYLPGGGAGANGNSVNNCTAVLTGNTTAPLWCETNVASNAGTSGAAGTTGTRCRGGGGGGSTVSGGGGNGGAITQCACAGESFLYTQILGAHSVGVTIWGLNSGGGCGAGDGVTQGSGGGGGGPWNILIGRNCGTGAFSVQSRGGHGAAKAGCANAGRGCGGGGGGSGGTIKLYCGAGTLPSIAVPDGTTGLDASPGCGGVGTGPVPGTRGGDGGAGFIQTYSPATGWTLTNDSTPWITCP